MANPFDHFGAFLLAVYSHLFTLLAGCVLTVILNFIEKHTPLKGKMTWKVDLVIVLLFLFFACFQAWQDEHQALQVTQKDERAAIQRFDDLTLPRLEGVIENTGIGPASPTNSDTVLIVWAEIKNGGSASIAEGFRTYIKMKDGREIVLQPVEDLPKTVSYVGKNVPLHTVSSEDYLARQAGRIPIPYGGAAHGFLIALARGMKTNEVQSSGNTLVLEFADFKGKTYTAHSSLDVAPLSITGVESLRGPSVRLR